MANDEHIQYHNDTRGDARYYTKTLLDSGQLDNRYFTESEHINTSAGAADAGKPVILNASGLIDASMVSFLLGSHSALLNLGADDHPQYHNDTRGDARYYTKTLLDNGQLDNRYYTETEIDSMLVLANEFVELTDTPNDYIGASGLYVRVNGTGLVFEQIDHTQLLSIGTNSHAVIDSHIADSTIHFTEGNIDHLNIQNVGINSHAQIDAHISASGSIHGIADTGDLALKSGSIAQFTTRNHNDLQNIGPNDHHNRLHNLNSTSDHSGTLPISMGGTGQTAKDEAFDALAPTTTKGDIIVYDGTTGDNVRLANGTEGQVLTADPSGAEPGVKWNTSSRTGFAASWATGSNPYINNAIPSLPNWYTMAKIMFPGSSVSGTPTYVRCNAWGNDADGFVLRIYDATNAQVIGTSSESNSGSEANIVNISSLSNIPSGAAIFEVQFSRGSGDLAINVRLSNLHIAF